MIGLDTNVLVRYLVLDDEAQSAAAAAVVDALTEATPGFLSLVTIVETWWVLRTAYGLEATTCADLVQGLLDAREVRIERDDVVRAALRVAREGADLADAVMAESGRVAGARHTVTFDRRAARLDRMHLLVV